MQTCFVWWSMEVGDAVLTSNGADGVVQAPAVTQVAAGTSLAAPTLAAFEHANNINITWVALDTNASVTPDGDFAELTDNAVASGSGTLSCQWAANQTGCTSTFASADAGAISIEVKAT